MQPSTRSLESVRPVTMRSWQDRPVPQPAPLPGIGFAPRPAPPPAPRIVPESEPSVQVVADDGREQLFETCGFAVSILIHTIVLVCLALIVFGEPPGEPPLAIVVLPGGDEAPQEVTFEPVMVVATPDHEDEAALLDLVAIGCPDDEPKQPVDPTIGDMVDSLPPPSAAGFVSTTLAPEGLLLCSVGDDGRGGGRGGPEASFYGLRAGGQKFVFVTDCSGSMTGQPFAELVRELRDTIERLPEGAEFAVIFFNHAPILRSAPTLEAATAEVKQDSLRWIASISPDGGTDPSQALAEALKLKPSVVFLLTDGRFAPKPTWDVIRRFNRNRRVQIHTIGLGSQVDALLLRQIAKKNRGQSRIIPE
jgi:uncharacterized protein YegL